MEESKNTFSLKYANAHKKNIHHKKIKFSDSYFVKYLESMEDQSKVSALHELRMEDDKTYFWSPYLKSKMIRENIRKVYKIGKWLGRGQFGSVRVGSPFANLNEKYAIKSVPREASEDYIRQLEKEFRILKAVDHPNIIKFYEAYQDQKYFHFVIEYWGGGELFTVLSKNGPPSEKESIKIIRKLCSAIAHLHDKDICHRDLKPENILFENKEPDAEIKLIDFGLSTFALNDRTMRTRVGTPFYVAPEVLKGEYQKSWDMWSIGVIAYVLLCGYPPFYAEGNEEIYRKIEKGKFTFPVEDWGKVSPAAKDFINKLLVLDPNKRMTPLKALGHVWLDSNEINPKIDMDIIKRLIQFKAPGRLESEFLLFLSKFVIPEEIK